VQNLLLYPLIGLLTVVPVTVSGFGVREGAFVFFYSLVGVPSEVAVGVSLLNYLLVIGVPALLGGLLLLFDRGRQITGRPG
jgi:glycosyltransferase 2 family protein